MLLLEPGNRTTINTLNWLNDIIRSCDVIPVLLSTSVPVCSPALHNIRAPTNWVGGLPITGRIASMSKRNYHTLIDFVTVSVTVTLPRYCKA